MKILIFLLLSLPPSWCAPLNDEGDVYVELELLDDGVHNQTDSNRSGKSFEHNEFALGDISASGEIIGDKVSIGHRLSIKVKQSSSESNALQEKPINPSDVEEPPPKENPFLGQWSAYGPCSKSCGGGIKKRTCLNTNPKQIKKSCSGSDVCPCNDQPCDDPTDDDTILYDDPGDDPQIVPEKCSISSFIPVPTDCAKYYQCSPGHPPALYTCAAGTRWNQARSYCDWPYNVACTTTLTECEAGPDILKADCYCKKNDGSKKLCTKGKICHDGDCLDYIKECNPGPDILKADCFCKKNDGSKKLCTKGKICQNGECLPYIQECNPGPDILKADCFCKNNYDSKKLCTKGKICQNGECLDYIQECIPGPDLIKDDCFCKNNDGNEKLCTTGNICQNGVCGIQDCAPDSNPLENDCLCKNANGGEDLCNEGQTCWDGACHDKICNTYKVSSEDCFCKGELSGGSLCRDGETCNPDGTCEVDCKVGQINPVTCLCGIGMCNAGEGCTKDETCLGVCDPDKKTDGPCFCQVGTSGAGEACTNNQKCTKNGKCLDVCNADGLNPAACFCEDGAKGAGAACAADQKCGNDGACLCEVGHTCWTICGGGSEQIEADCFCKNNDGKFELCAAGKLCEGGKCIDKTIPSENKGLPSKVLGLYLLLAEWTDREVSDPELYEYQQTGANVLFFTWIHPKEMDVPESFKKLAATRGTNTEGAVPADTKIIFAIGGETYSYDPNPWPWLTSKSKAEEMAIKVAKWKDNNYCDGIDLDIEKGAGNQAVAGQNMIHFVKKIKELKPDMIITQPVWGYPEQVPANDKMVNAAWTSSGVSNGLLDSVGIMWYVNLDSLIYVKNYVNGNGPITAKVPHDKMLVGIQGTASSENIVALAEKCREQNLLGIMVWLSSVKNGFTYGEDSSGNEDSKNGFKKAMEILRQDME